MAKENCTLEDLLEHHESTLLIAGSPKDNKKLVAMLGTPDNLMKLLQYAWEEPVLASTVSQGILPFSRSHKLIFRSNPNLIETVKDLRSLPSNHVTNICTIKQNRQIRRMS